jgi:hypothetical protein
MHSIRKTAAVLALVAALSLATGTAHAYRFIQNQNVGRTSSGYLVTCTDPNGFTHWGNSAIAWYLNPAGQGSNKAAAMQSALQTWTNVGGAPHTLSYAGTTSSGFTTDGRNTVLWARGNGCNGSCLAITALVLASGQVITETDISFNTRYTWNTNGSNYDTEAVLLHELGHTLGLHHTEVTSTPRPTMYAYYFGIDGRTLENDDISGLQCSASRYPPAVQQAIAQASLRATATDRAVTLSSRPREGGAILRFGLRSEGYVKLQLFDVAGRQIATLVDGVQPAGDREIAWDGSGSAGRARSGMYFARMTTPAGAARATVILAE